MKLEGHLRRWLEDACDMENEGDRVAWEQYQALVHAAKNVIWKLSHNHSKGDGSPSYPGTIDRRDATIHLVEAALKAAEGE